MTVAAALAGRRSTSSNVLVAGASDGSS